MALPPPLCHSLPVEMHVTVTDIVDVENDVTYWKCSTTVWVQEDANEMVPHRYVAWFILMDGDLIGPLLGFSGPPGITGNGL